MIIIELETNTGIMETNVMNYSINQSIDWLRKRISGILKLWVFDYVSIPMLRSLSLSNDFCMSYFLIEINCIIQDSLPDLIN